MERLFETHHVRKGCDAAPLWTLTTLDEGGLSVPEKMIIPGVWESLPQLRNYHGRGVFEQQITCGGNIRLWFGGVSFRAQVTLDDSQIAAHYGAYTGFDAVVKGVTPGAHTLRIEVDNRFGEDSALHIPNDYYAYGGINRPVIIEEVADSYIKSLHVTPVLVDGIWHAKIMAHVRNLTLQEKRYTLRLEIQGVSVDKMVLLPINGEAAVAADIVCPKAQTWSPENPALTTITATLMKNNEPLDDLIERFGFREIKVEGKQILLNGKPIRLKGFNRHEEMADFGLAVPMEAMVRDVQLLRDLGANCVRTCHYPNDPRFLDLCDEFGLLVWEEAHSRGMSEAQMKNPHFMEQLKQCAQEMVDQHFNHPCIFIWGCLNECADNTEYGADCYRKTFHLLHELDHSRPATAALLEREGTLVAGDTDVVSINIYPRWYNNASVSAGLAKKINECVTRGGKDKPIIISEIGAGAIYGYHDPLGEAKWSEERQCTILREQIEGVLTHPDCTGLFLWQFADVRVDESWFSGRPRTFNNKGVVDEYRRPKLSYALVKELFHRL